MATITKNYSIDIDPDRVWDVLAEPSRIRSLFSFLTEASGDQDKRVCVMSDGSELHERFFSIDHQARRVAYTITSSPFGLEAHASAWSVKPSGEGSVVSLVIDVLPDSAGEMLDAMLESEQANIEAGLRGGASKPT